MPLQKTANIVLHYIVIYFNNKELQKIFSENKILFFLYELIFLFLRFIFLNNRTKIKC